MYFTYQLIKFLERNDQSKAGLDCGGQNTPQEAQAKCDRLWLLESGVPLCQCTQWAGHAMLRTSLAPNSGSRGREPTRPVCIVYAST